METFVNIFCAIDIFIFGLLIGSFTAASAYRIPKKIKISKGRSMCPSCGTQLRWFDLVPVLSFVFLGGRCRYCKKPISALYPIVEILNASAYLLIFLQFGSTIKTVACMAIASSLILLSAVDIKYMEIPDRTVLIILSAGIIMAVFSNSPYFGPGTGDVTIIDRLIGFVAVSVPFLIIALIKPEGMGGGDIKLMAASGFALGWKYIIAALVIGSCSGAVYGLWSIIRKKKGKGDQIPFGPFLAAGIFISMTYGKEIIDCYLRFAETGFGQV